jgi:HK97 family phage portal protein
MSADLLYTIRNQGWPWGSYGAMYRRQPAVRTVVDFIARNVAQLNAKVYYRLANADRLEVDDHRLAVLLRNPNPNTSRYRHTFDTVADLAIYDRAYWLKLRNGERTAAVVRIPPSRITREAGPGGRSVYRIERPETDGPLYVGRDRLVVFHGYNPEGDEEGVSPLETLRRVLAEEWAATEHRENFWRNAARQSGVIQRPMDAPEWSDEARQRFRADWESTMAGGANSGRTGILEEGMTWNAAAFSPKDAEYIEGRKLTYEEVSRAYGVPPTLIGTTGETKANVESFHRQMYQDVLGPWLRMLQDEIELQLLPEFEAFSNRGRVYVEYNLNEKLRGSFEEQGKTLVTAVGVPYMTPNEARARLNLPRIDDPSFDLPVQPLNVLYGGQPAVTVPTEDPGMASTSAQTKAVPAVAVRRRMEVAKRHQELFRKFFERQERAVISSLGKSKKAKAKWDEERWNNELTADLYALATQVAGETGRRAARELKGTYDETRTLSYLEEGARRTAEEINSHTRDKVAEAIEDGDVGDVFEEAKTSRAAQLAMSRATQLVNFARTEAAKHSEDSDGRRRVKTWIVTNPKSRHPHMHGEQVAAFQRFSNGAEWPGDPALPADQAAGCQCFVELGG